MDQQAAVSVLKKFIMAMNQWETHYFPLFTDKITNQEGFWVPRDPVAHTNAGIQAKKDLDTIFALYLTKRERKYGRQASLSCGSPPTYSPDEKILKIEELKKNKLVIYTQQQVGVEMEFRYTLHFKFKEWRIDKKEAYDVIDEKWVKFSL